ncbi:RNI-like protein [Trametopsis cervina]|nr:RNI-like protein [Trametopsis cervina]
MYGSVDWPSAAGPSSYGSGHIPSSSEGFSPVSISAALEASMSTPTSPEMPSLVASDAHRRRTVSGTSRRSLSVPTIPRMKVKFTGIKGPKGPSGTLARKLLFRKSPPTSPQPRVINLQETATNSAMLSDIGFLGTGNCLSPWSRSPPATPFVETNSVWGVVDSRPMNKDLSLSTSLPIRTKGRSYSSPLPFPSTSIFDIVPLDAVDIFGSLPAAEPAYFDEHLPREVKLLIFTALLDSHEAEFEKRVQDSSRWTALKAASSRSKWVGREKGFRELVKLSRVSRSWRELAFDGQLWSNLDLRAFPKVHSSVLVRISQLAGGFIQHLSLAGISNVSPATLMDMSHHLSVHPALPGDLSSTTHNRLTSLDLRGCPALTSRSLHHILIRSPLLERLCLRGQKCVLDTTCDVLANYCPRLVSLDLSRCSNLTGDGIRSAASYAISRGEHMRLKQLKLSGLRKVSDETMRILGKATPLLEVLDLSYARDLHNSAIEAFVSCTEEEAQGTEAVQLTAREAGRDVSNSGRYWRRVTRLRHLNLSCCVLLTDHACSHLAHAVPRLEFLELAGIGPDMGNDGLVRLLNTTPFIRRLDLEDATDVSDDVLVALTPTAPVPAPQSRSAAVPPEPGHALEHLIISYSNVESETLSELIRACPRLRVLEADNTRMTSLTLKEFVQTARRRNTVDAKLVAVDCRSVGEFSVKDMTPYTRPRLGWRSWHARKLGYLDGRDNEELTVGQDECDPHRVVVKTFYSWQTVDAVQAAREKKRKSGSRRSANTTGTSSNAEDTDSPNTGRARWWSPNGRRSTGPSTPTLLDLNTDRGESCIIM